MVTMKAVLPPILYKYCPPERIDIITSFRIRFSPPSEFNDTFDTRFIPPVSEREKGARIGPRQTPESAWYPLLDQGG